MLKKTDKNVDKNCVNELNGLGFESNHRLVRMTFLLDV
jgi:hypothetical protein